MAMPPNEAAALAALRFNYERIYVRPPRWPNLARSSSAACAGRVLHDRPDLMPDGREIPLGPTPPYAPQ